ncbi:hypothetical protein GH975_07550 [Litorivicinus lipolyticus]|uniref:histidine kinase n=1 Tax=Litorivicinus lipolyticus TaxID=418701 RepID=A0A5Q2QBG4_9GAMM|nr:hypothetical protein GH975_07550 [Litorivicinus lipolyticus]
MVAFTQAFFSRQWLGNAIRRVTQLLTVATVIVIACGALIDFSTTVLAWSLGTYVALTLCMVGLVHHRDGQRGAMRSSERALRHQVMVNQSRERFLNEMNHEIRPHVELCVEDNGIGMPAHELELATTPLFRGRHALQHRPDGSRMGLAIVSQIVAELNGQFTLSSSAGVKACASVTLEAAEPVVGTAEPALGLEQHRILSGLIAAGTMSDILEFASQLDHSHPQLASQLRVAVDALDVAALVKLTHA